MSIEFSGRVEGLPELSRALKELDPRKQVNAIRGAARASLLPVEKTAKAVAPKGTESHRTYKGRLVAPGFLSRSINRTSYRSRDRLRIGATVGTKKEAFYGRQFVEVGTAHTAPSPWLRPAYRANRRKVERLFAEKLREHIIKQAKKVRKYR